MTPMRNDGFMIDDAEYGYNKTEPLRAAFAKSVSAISNLHVLTINRTFGSVIPDDLVACVSLRVNDTDRADGQSECPFSNRKAMDAYAKIRGDAEAALSRARNGVAEFADDAEDFTAAALLLGGGDRDELIELGVAVLEPALGRGGDRREGLVRLRV